MLVQHQQLRIILKKRTIGKGKSRWARASRAITTKTTAAILDSGPDHLEATYVPRASSQETARALSFDLYWNHLRSPFERRGTWLECDSNVKVRQGRSLRRNWSNITVSFGRALPGSELLVGTKKSFERATPRKADFQLCTRPPVLFWVNSSNIVVGSSCCVPGKCRKCEKNIGKVQESVSMCFVVVIKLSRDRDLGRRRWFESEFSVDSKCDMWP